MKRHLLKGGILDFGCGHGKDTEELAQLGYSVDKYDKYHHPTFPKKRYTTVICHYVLNVVGTQDQSKILAEVSMLLAPGGKAYFTVRRDIFRPGIRIHKYHQRPTYQCNVILPFRSVLKTDHCEIYEYTKPLDKEIITETISVTALWKDNKIRYQKKEMPNSRTNKAIGLLHDLLKEEKCKFFIPSIEKRYKERRNSLRLRNYDYAQEGGYFITINVKNFRRVFGMVKNGEMYLNPLGEMVRNEWLNSSFRSNVTVEDVIVMPNHIHGIVVINYAKRKIKFENRKFRSPSMDISAVVRGFKSATTKKAKEMGFKLEGSLWHRNFHDVIIRDQERYENTVRYINNNPRKWGEKYCGK
ncbi:hypothetical protein NH26_01470 [Flammeovirga pacifica]|uniref:Transposase IS200-like domain-containing protein n=2 Tax=Flammeovirga pacifica TaxID=915059 RepID=A0A1S1YVQ3_FLAPC|nr:hypothetical protein NH26_01470 [Flammeovirga pacifica]